MKELSTNCGTQDRQGFKDVACGHQRLQHIEVYKQHRNGRNRNDDWSEVFSTLDKIDLSDPVGIYQPPQQLMREATGTTSK